MPTYDYQCLKCGHTFEMFQKMSDAALKVCPVCKGDLKRLIGSGCGLIFKGSGFYITDYKRKSPSCTEENKSKDSTCPNNKSDSCPTDNCPKSKKEPDK